jgi:hypothetical protein
MLPSLFHSHCTYKECGVNAISVCLLYLVLEREQETNSFFIYYLYNDAVSSIKLRDE